VKDKAARWSNLPNDMKERPQWAVSGASKAPMGLGPQGGLRLISVTEPSTWMSFDEACGCAWANRETVTTHVTSEGVTIRQTGLDVGYILNAADPFTCIDLDVKDAVTTPNHPEKWTTPDDFQRYVSIIEHFDSYTERSKSGKGIHVWVRGNIGRGFRRDGIEIYSQERYIISTGDVYVRKGVEDREYLLANMIHQMRPLQKVIELEELPQEADDWYVLQIAISASNSDKFGKLWKGLWREDEFNFPSQSEADLALMSMFTFYSESNAQCRRLFRESGLGKREKAQKDDRYINNTLKTIRDRQSRERNVELSGILQAADNMMALAREGIQALQGGVPPAQQVAGAFGTVAPRTVAPLQVPGTGEPTVTSPPPEAALAQLAPVTESAVAAGAEGLPWPPGFVGALAQFVYNNSFLPIKEVAITAALGLMSGVCGKAWHIPKSGLNLYIVLVARSAIGKEALHTGISTVVSACIREFPQFGNFVDFTEYASGPALIKACAQNTSFVNVSGEWGRRMKRIAMEDDREGPMTTLRTQMTNLYQKSAPMSIVGGIGYSSVENNIEALQSVAYSMVGESTPQTFYDSLTESMMEDGFLSRFLVIQYDGDRPNENANMIEYPDSALTKYLCGMAFQADANIGNGTSQPVDRTEEAARTLSEFSHRAADNIRSTNDEARRQMWNRATLKVLRIAALLAVGDNYMHPVIEKRHCDWAIDLIMQDIEIMKKRLSSGDVGLNDSSRERKAVAVIQEYLSKPIPKSYKVPDEMRQAGIIPRPYIQQRTARASAFYKHKFGPNKALDEVLNNLVGSGYIMEVKGDKLVEMFNYHGKAFRVIKLPDYESMAADRE
jgi:hypothetical protein